jgi:hypothetical protein
MVVGDDVALGVVHKTRASTLGALHQVRCVDVTPAVMPHTHSAHTALTMQHLCIYVWDVCDAALFYGTVCTSCVCVCGCVHAVHDCVCVANHAHEHIHGISKRLKYSPNIL